MDNTFEQEQVIQEVRKLRQNHPRLGGRKLYELMEPFMIQHQIKMGRDALFDVLSRNNLLVKKRRRRITTTNSFHWLRKWPNLIRDFVPSKRNELWVSDITYWKTENDVFYISLIMDVYSHKIVGYNVSCDLEASGTIAALKMALSDNLEVTDLVHHSDRGVQYCSNDYVSILKENGIKISMTENGDPLENAHAERVNGIIKNEYLECYDVYNIIEAQNLLSKVIDLYNNERPHMSISNKVPQYVHQSNEKLERKWKNYYKSSSIVNQFQDNLDVVNQFQD